MDPLRYLTSRATHPVPRQSDQLLRHRLALAKDLSHKDLVGHFGCVNALEFSHGLGNKLASGGDDRRVLYWDVEKALSDIGKPITMKGEHNSNIFCLAFDVTNSTLFSGGNDEQVIVHDIATGVTKDVYLHDDAVYGLSPDPSNPNVFASSCDDGRVLIYDTRDSTEEPFCLANYTSSMHSVMYNPMEPRLLATANAKEGVGLWDVRKPKSCVLRYGGAYAQQSCMSIRFNQLGDQIVALRRRLPPVLYKIDSNVPVCEFDHSGYYNSCTMKSVSFAGDLDQYVISGSDEFNLYMWAIPEDLSERLFINSAHMVLKGHRSIVNQVRFNIANHLIVSSGVEKVIKVWSPFKFPTKQADEDSCKKMVRGRPVYSHEEYINLVLENGHVMSHDYSHESTEEDPRMIAFFDSLVQRELEGLSSDDSLSSNEEALYSRIVQLSQSDIDSDDSLNERLEQNSDAEPNFSPFTIAFASVMASQASDGNDRFPRLNNALNTTENNLQREQINSGTGNVGPVSPGRTTDTGRDTGSCDISRLVQKKKLELRHNVQRKLKDCSAKLSSTSNEDMSDSSEPDMSDVKESANPALTNNAEKTLSQATQQCHERLNEARKQAQVQLKRLRNLRQRVQQSDSDNSDTEKVEALCLTSTPANDSKTESKTTEREKFKKFRRRRRSSDVTDDKVTSVGSPDLGPFLQQTESNNTNNEIGNSSLDSFSRKGKKYSPDESVTGKGKVRDGNRLEGSVGIGETGYDEYTTKPSVFDWERQCDHERPNKANMDCDGSMSYKNMGCTIPNCYGKQLSKHEASDVKVARKRSLSTSHKEKPCSGDQVTRHKSLSPSNSKHRCPQIETGDVVCSHRQSSQNHDTYNCGYQTFTDDVRPSCSYMENNDINKTGASLDQTSSIKGHTDTEKDVTLGGSRNKKEEGCEEDQPTWSEFKRFKNKVERARHRYNEHRKQKKHRHQRDER